MNIAAIHDEISKQVDALGDAGKIATCVRMTCEQVASIPCKYGKIVEIGDLPIVTRGSIADCNMRAARPRIPYVDLTKLEA